MVGILAILISGAFAPAWAGLEISGTPGVSGATAPTGRTEEQPIELFHVVFEGGVTLETRPDGSTCSRGWSNPDPIPTACLPDPHSLICSSIERPILEKARRLEQRLEPYNQILMRETTNAVASAVRELGPIPARGARGRDRYRERFSERVGRALIPAVTAVEVGLTEELLPTRRRVSANIDRAREIFLRALSRAGGLSPRDRQILSRLIECVKNPQLKGIDTERNAAMLTARPVERYGWSARSLLEDGVDLVLTNGLQVQDLLAEGDDGRRRVNPLLETNRSCFILLSAKTWIDCEEGGPACFTTLFHEMGHLLTSCSFRRVAADARTVREDLPYSSGSRQVMDFLSNQADSLAGNLEDNASCLATLSSPRNAVLDSCDPPPGTPRATLERCGMGEHAGYPSQWDEAEADFWGATATAQWLQESYSEPDARAHAIYEASAQWCADSRLERARPAPSADVLRANELVTEPPGGCQSEFARGRRPAADPWRDPHQDWPTRINRNVLRNSDLRQALGCPSRAEIPMTCSPRGVVRARIP